MNSTPWMLRIKNNCLFVDDTSSNRVLLQHNARPGLRPYIHPLRLEDGRTCLTEDSPWHHPWQHGISTGFHGVNGCDFWLDPGQHPTMSIGTIESSTPRILKTEPPTWQIEALWRHANGSYLLLEQQTWSLQKSDSLLYLDLDWSLQAIPDVHIVQDDYGGLFIRMPFRSGMNAKVVSSEGLQDDDTEQQAASWLSLHMPLENCETGGGISVFDHPDNPQHPTKWRVDHQRGINPAPCITSSIDLASGEKLRHRYRLVLHADKLTVDQINAQWRYYVQEG